MLFTRWTCFLEDIPPILLSWRSVLTMEHPYDRPDLHRSDYIFAPRGQYSDELLESRKGLNPDYEEMLAGKELCRACGWTSSHEMHASYDPRVKIIHARKAMGLWAIGRKWILRDQPNDSTQGNDYMTQQFIRNQPDLNSKVPLVEKMCLLSEPDDQIHFTLMSQAQGDRLDRVWDTLTREQKFNYAFQLTDIVKSLRQFHKPTAQKVNGDRLDDNVLTQCLDIHPPTCKKIGATNEEWFDNMAWELRHGLARIHRTRDPKVIDEKLQQLKDNFPPSEPYVLSHGDLHLSNVFVKDDKIEAIIDWEMAGYHPWWVERARMGFYWPCSGDDDIFDAAWERIEPEWTYKRLNEELWPRIFPVKKAYQACGIDHVELFTAWLRPDWCECKRFAGSLRLSDLGQGNGHQIRNFDPTLAAPGTTVQTERVPDS